MTHLMDLYWLARLYIEMACYGVLIYASIVCISDIRKRRKYT